jgi:polar amino acid transport system substrate-binding protein
LKNATVVRAETSAGAVSLFESEGVDAAAGIRQPLELKAQSHPGLRVIPGRFTAIEQAMGIVAGRNAGFQELIKFIEEMKSTGFVSNLLVRHNKQEATIAP